MQNNKADSYYPSTEEMVCLHTYSQLEECDYINWAVGMILSAHDTPLICILAGSDNDNWADLDNLFVRCLIELNFDPEFDPSLLEYLKYRAKAVIDHRCQPGKLIIEFYEISQKQYHPILKLSEYLYHADDYWDFLIIKNRLIEKNFWEARDKDIYNYCDLMLKADSLDSKISMEFEYEKVMAEIWKKYKISGYP